MLQTKKDRTHLYELLLKFAHFLFLTYSLIGHIPIFKSPLKYSTFIGIGLLIINFFLQYNKSEIKEFFVYVTLMLVALIHSYFSGNYGFFKLMLFAGSIRKVDFGIIVKFDMYLRAALIAIVAILCQFGFATDVIMTYNGIVRHSLGFTNPNALGVATFVLACDMFYVYRMKMNFKRFIILLLLSYWLYAVARCRTAVYAILALLLMAVVYTLKPRLFKNRATKFIFYLTPFALSLFTLVATYAYMNNSSWAISLNQMLTGRIGSVANFARVLSPKLWGQPIGETINHSLDNTYGFIWLDLGIIVFALFVFGYIRLIKNNYKYDNIPLCIILFTFMCYGVSEHLWINIDYNVFMLAFFYDPGKFVSKNDRREAIAYNSNYYRNLYDRYEHSLQ